MPRQSLSVEVTADEATGKLVAVYIRVADGEAAETREVEAGRAFADYDEGGHLIGLELLGPCREETLRSILLPEPERVRRFITEAAPRELVPA